MTTNIDYEGYDNEAFLYNDNKNEKMFKKGLICDSDGNLICILSAPPVCCILVLLYLVLYFRYFE